MPKVNMIGFKTGRLSVIEFSHHSNRNLYWKALCDCGNIRTISTGELNRGRSKIPSCGCYKHPIKNYEGHVYNFLTVKKYSHTEKGKSCWECECVCGNKKVICSESFKRGKTKSCGCLNTTGSDLWKKKTIDNLKDRIKISDNGCWEWQESINISGYGSLRIPELRIQTAHRASFYLFKGKIPKGKYILHHCDNKICCNPEHLYAGTAKDNARDALERGLHPVGPNLKKGHKGSKNCRAKLNESDVNRIRGLRKQGSKVKDLAKEYCVNGKTISDICKGKTWVS